MPSDIYGQSVTTDSTETVALIDTFMEGFLGNETRAGKILEAAAVDPDCALAGAYAAALMMLMESPAGQAKARQHIARARDATDHISDRERGVLNAVGAWVDGDVRTSLEIGEALLTAHPSELVLAKLCQTHHFNLGNAPGMLRTAHLVADAHRDDAHLHGMLAFGYEQCHLLEQAEAAARRALELKHKEPWAQHALAHVLLTEGRTDEGTAFLRAAATTWEDLSSFMYTHNWWHLCLFLLDRGAYDEVLSAYDTHVWGIDKSYSQDQIGAVSLLLRLELHGVDVGARWRDVAHHLKSRIDDHVQPFLDLHYVYGLARAGEVEADALLASLEHHAARAPTAERGRWREVALPAAHGLAAHARGDYRRVLKTLGTTIGVMARIGGSHAQRELFEMVLLDAQIRCGELIAAQQKLELERRRDERSPFVWRQLAEVYGGLGLPVEADAARRTFESLEAQGSA